MAQGDVPADALSDLRADGNKLSVWSVRPELEDLNRVLVALASNRQHLDKLDYTLINEEILSAIPIKYVQSEGCTPHLTANTTAHRDLIELTARKVAHLAEQMSGLERVRVTEKQVKRLLCNALADGALDRTEFMRSSSLNWNLN